MNLKTIAVTLGLALAQVACSGKEPSVAVCERADSCGLLDGTVESCTRAIDDWYVEALNAQGQEECPGELELCADKSSCDSFGACMFEGRAYACHPYE